MKTWVPLFPVGLLAAVLSAVLLLLPAASFGQDHAPTAQQCQADQRFWFGQIDTPPELSKLSFRELQQRAEEMHKCNAVDATNVRYYQATQELLHFEQLHRLEHFLERHSLMGKFLAEDDAGKR
ncbi:MAG: hypothetical protein WAL41_03615 [Mycobacterium sp.]